MNKTGTLSSVSIQPGEGQGATVQGGVRQSIKRVWRDPEKGALKPARWSEGGFSGEETAKLHTKRRERVFRGERKEKGIQRRGNNKSHELLSRPGMLGEMKESFIEWMAGNGAKWGWIGARLWSTCCDRSSREREQPHWLTHSLADTRHHFRTHRFHLKRKSFHLYCPTRTGRRGGQKQCKSSTDLGTYLE